MVRHLLQITGILLIAAVCILYPFLPGPYDSLAVALSSMAQAYGVFGLILVPVGGAWLLHELSMRRTNGSRPTSARRSYFAHAAVVVWALVGVGVALVGYAIVGVSLGLVSLALWFLVLYRVVRRSGEVKPREGDCFHSTPVYMVVLPIGVLAFQLWVAAPITQFSRDYAIEESAEYIREIERYAVQREHYPVSLLAMWKDYYPSIVGIEKYHYMPNGDTYNLFFEQPRLLLDNIGTREWVVYNPQDRQTMYSHTSWILLLTPEELAGSQGWYAVNDASKPHWKYFWFD